MFVLIIGDLHFRKDNLDIMSKVCEEILQIIDAKKPDLVVSLGDTLDTHERLYLPALTDATKFYVEISKKCELVVLIGNHDRQNNSDFLSEIHPFVGLKEYPNITIVDTTIWDKEKNFIYVPYVPNGRFNEALSKVNYRPFQDNKVEHPRLIFGHQEFQGCIMGAKTSTDGDVWSVQFPQIFSGHIHGYHNINNICYVGTPLQQNYGEDTDKALMMVHLEEDSFSIDRIRLVSAPIKVTVNMEISQLPDFANHIPPNCLVKVVLHIDALDLVAIKSNPHYLAMKSMVDKVTEKVVSNKLSIAERMVNDFKEKGTLDQEKKIYDIDEIVRAMLADDIYALNVYNTEISI